MKTLKLKIAQSVWIIIGLLALLFQIGLLYYIYWHRHFLVPPGNDVVVHFQIIENILKNGQFSYSYPPGFHLLVIALSKIFHMDIWTILTNGSPFLMLLPALCMFFLLRQLFSVRVSIISSIILLLTSGYPLYAFIDGNYPDMLAYGVFSVLLFAFLIRYFKNKKIPNLIWAAILLVLIALTHHFTFFNILVILIIFALYKIYLRLMKANLKLSLKVFWSVGILCFISSVIYLVANGLYGGVVLKFMTNVLTSSTVGQSHFNVVPSYGDYSSLVGNLIWYFGLAGFFYLIITHFAQKELSSVKPLIIIWLLFFYILSRLSIFGYPARFARELALPLTVTMAFLLDYLIEQNVNRQRFGQILAGGLIGYLILMNSALYTGLARIPDGFSSHIWYWPIDQAKIEYIQANVPQSSTILYNPSANLFFPVKSDRQLEPMTLSAAQVQIVNRYLKFPKNKSAQKDYIALVAELKVRYQDIDIIFDDVQPPGADSAYPAYADYSAKKTVIESLAASDKVLQTFDDSATLYRKTE